jgi:Na+-driven multidrug efflux pump
VSAVKFLLFWMLSLVLGVLAGYALGWALWKAGLDLAGSAIALIGAGIGAFVVLFALLRWSDNRRYSR